MRFAQSSIYLCQTSSSDNNIPSNEVKSGFSDGGLVSVRVERNLPEAKPKEARDAWLEHHWRKGGGLPIFIIEKENKRVVAPIMMEETLMIPNEEEASVSIEYKVTQPGPLFGLDLVSGSHEGLVSFESIGSGCKMTWDVSFETKRFKSLYESFTSFTVGTAARTVAESVSTPRLLTVKSTLEGAADPDEARREWLEFFWARGGGLPLLPPIPFGDVLEEGRGYARKSILRVPPLLIDTVISTETSPFMAEAIYQIENPGWTTFPFLIHTHLGRAQFVMSETEGAINIIWEIECRPFPFTSVVVEKLLEMTASTIVRNLRVRLAEPGERVEIKPPRGNTDLGISSFGSVSKDTWLGGVLHAHLTDRRSTAEQTLSLLQPWTWGRSGEGDENDSVCFNWSDGTMAS